MEKFTAKLFQNGRSQAMRLPQEFWFEGTEVYIRRDEKTGEVARLQSIAWGTSRLVTLTWSALEKEGSIIGGMDMLIAGHAVSLGLPFVTNNVREFRRVPDLVVENWT